MTQAEDQQHPVAETLGDLRGRIDEIDAALTRLIEERLAVADRIGAKKRRLGLAVHALKREDELLERIAAKAPAADRPTILSVYETLISGSRRRQLEPVIERPPCPNAGVLEAMRPVAAGEDAAALTKKLLAAFAAAGAAPTRLRADPESVRIRWKSAGGAAARLLAADLAGLGASVAPALAHAACAPIPGAGLLCGLLGRTLSHTLSPAIHARLGVYAYKCFEVEPERLERFFAETPFDGLNVTIPYKEAVLPYCTRLSENARKVGAVNTLVREPDGTLTGDNTDYDGFLAMVKESGVECAGRKALVLGSGGAAKCVRQVLEDLGARPVIVSRSGPVNYENIAEHADAEILVNATPVGMYPRSGATPVADLTVLPNLRMVFDLIYNPTKTKLILDAERLGIPTMNGLLMLVHQALEASRRFLGGAEPAVNARGLMAKLALDAENIVLIGMPGSGKSTIGRIVAQKLGLEFVDLDDAIEAAAECSIPEIFEREGEKAFRDLESSITQVVGARRGVVIATGGGTLLRPQNRDALRQNGRLVLIKRALDDLPTSGRPVSQSKPLARLWEERCEIYEGNADAVVVNNADPEAVVRLVLEAVGRADAA